MNEYLINDIEIGNRASFTKTITREMEDSFRLISGDDNPLHRDDNFAQLVSDGKLDRHIAFGMLTASFYSTVAGMYLPGKYSLIHSFDEISFLNPVYIGDELTVNAEVIDKIVDIKMIRLKIKITNQDGKLVSKAKMKVLLLK